MKRTTQQVHEAMHFLNAIKILMDLKDKSFIYGNHIDLLWRCLEEIEIDDTLNED